MDYRKLSLLARLQHRRPVHPGATADTLDEIVVLGNQGERSWQGSNPDPTKGVQPIRDSNGKITGWSGAQPADRQEDWEIIGVGPTEWS
jgi:hypothetical protein